MRKNESKGQILEIPTTGRIGRLAKIIEQETDRDILEKVMQDVEQFKLFNYAQKASWIKGVIERLEQLTGEKTAMKIMEQCGRLCCGQTYRKKVKQIMNDSESLEEFLENLNKKGLGGGRLTLIDETTITGGYDHCYCGKVKQTHLRR